MTHAKAMSNSSTWLSYKSFAEPNAMVHNHIQSALKTASESDRINRRAAQESIVASFAIVYKNCLLLFEIMNQIKQERASGY